MPVPFLDTNLFLRHLLADDPEQSPRATAYFAKIEQGLIQVCTSELVIFDTVFTLQRRSGRPKSVIRDSLLPLIELPGIRLPGKRRLRRVFELYVDQNLPFADAYHVALMERLGLTAIATFDREFDRVPGIKRVEL
ncbi:MAG: PIN domain-containing protein [Chloroflexi bacterium]|nr:PIN domain-containing protein [Chloroflexota bacterium]